MHKQVINQFATERQKNGTVKAGRSVIIQPKTNYKGGETKWFDDSKLLKRNRN